jgi:transmembrane 9 superfamily member 2/4
MEQYRLPLCQPEGGPKSDNQNLGEFLAGDRIESSPFRLKMKVEMYCEQLCVTNLGRGEQKGSSPNKVVQAIRKNYHNNWIVDNLPSASKVEDDATVTTRYWQGFPVGYVDPNNNKSYINNHVNIEIMYHPVETEAGKYRIVHFTVEPFSIMHQFELVDNDNEVMEMETKFGYKNTHKDSNSAYIYNPVPSCSKSNANMTNSSRSMPIHTRNNMIQDYKHEHQLASGQVLFTYDVIWVENKDLKWSNRWDI